MGQIFLRRSQKVIKGLKSNFMDEEVLEIMKDYDLDKETAEKVVKIMNDEGLDAEDAIELVDDV